MNYVAQPTCAHAIRAALGFNKRHLYLVAVDGRRQELPVGMSSVELASLLEQLGCTEGHP